MTISTQDSIKIIDRMNQIKRDTTSSSDTYKEHALQKLEELLRGTETNNKTLDEILEKINKLTDKEIREQRMQEGALTLMTGMMTGSVGVHIASGGKFDILKNCPKITQVLNSKIGKCIGGAMAIGGSILGIIGVKKMIE